MNRRNFLSALGIGAIGVTTARFSGSVMNEAIKPGVEPDIEIWGEKTLAVKDDAHPCIYSGGAKRPCTGDMWFNSESTYSIYDGTKWVEVKGV